MNTVTAPVSAPVSAVANIDMNVDMVLLIGRSPEGKPQVICAGKNTMGGIASLFAPLETPALAAPKEVELAPPIAEKPAKVKPAKEKGKGKTLDELILEAKGLGIKGAHLFRKVEKCQAAIDAKRGNAPTQSAPPAQPAPSAPQSTPAPTRTPYKGKGKGKFNGDIMKDTFKLSTASKCLILTKKNKEMEVYAVEEVELKKDGNLHKENVAANAYKKDELVGFTVCNPDEGGINRADDTIFGGYWVVPYCRVLKWID